MEKGVFIKTNKIEELVKLNTNLDKGRFLTEVDFGSTYQGTGDAESDTDYVLVYLNKIDDFIIQNTKIRNKHYPEIEVRVVPLVRLVDLFTRPSYDSLLILNRIMEENSVFSQYMFDYMYNIGNYTEYLSQNEKTLGMSIVQNIYSATKRYSKEKMSGKTLVKLVTFISVYERYTDLIDKTSKQSDESYRTISKIKDEYKDVIPLKRYSYEDIKQNISKVNDLNFFKVRNKKIGTVEDILKEFKRIEEEIKERVESKELTKTENKDFGNVYENTMYDKVIKLHKEYL